MTVAALARLLRETSRRAKPTDDWPAPSRNPPAIVLPSLSRPAGVLVLTKPRGLLTEDVFESAPERLTVFARYGPLSEWHLERIRCECRRGARVVRFVGDLDPLDLTVFLTLLVGLRHEGCRVEYLGVGARWLSICREHVRSRRAKPLPHGLPTIPMTSFETQLLLRLSAVVDLADLVGPDAVDILHGGSKLELEGASNPVFYDASFSRYIHRLLWGRERSRISSDPMLDQ